MDIVEQLIKAPQDVKLFLKSELERIFADNIKQEAISGNLFYETRDERFNMIMKKLKAILNGI